MKKSITAFLLLICSLAFAISLHAQTGFGINDEDRAEFARHRAALFQRLGDDVAVFFGAYKRSDFLRWRQENRFYYLTGVEIPFAALILDGRTEQEILFLPPARTGRSEIFDGSTIGPGPQAVAEFGIQDTRPIAQLEQVIREKISSGGRILTVLRPAEVIAGGNDAASSGFNAASAYPWSQHNTREMYISSWLAGLVSEVKVVDISPVVDDLRRLKSPWEITRMREACRIAGLGHEAAIRATAPEKMEYEIEAAAMERFIANGALFPSYNAIVGSGPNNTILHYMLSARRAKAGELVLMDFGPDFRYYSADITRTWPVSGTFDPEQRKAYQDCLDVQKKLIAAVKPGVTFSQLSLLNQRYFGELGYTRENVLHGPCHYIGMSVHDVGEYQKPFEPGVVFTVEPGIYFRDKGWGIRIEDVVLVTKNGSEVLSRMIPKEVNEIEQMMSMGRNLNKK